MDAAPDVHAAGQHRHGRAKKASPDASTVQSIRTCLRRAVFADRAAHSQAQQDSCLPRAFGRDLSRRHSFGGTAARKSRQELEATTQRSHCPDHPDSLRFNATATQASLPQRASSTTCSPALGKNKTRGSARGSERRSREATLESGQFATTETCRTAAGMEKEEQQEQSQQQSEIANPTAGTTRRRVGAFSQEGSRSSWCRRLERRTRVHKQTRKAGSGTHAQ